MTLKSAQQEILRASDFGIQTFLYKPFTRADVGKAFEQIMKDVEESSSKRLHYLTMKGKTPILDCPAQKSSKFRFIAEFLNSEIIKEIDDIAEGGSQHLIIRIGEGFLSTIAMRQKFITLIEHTYELGLTIRLVVESSECRDILRNIEETSSIPIDVTLECALGSVA
jgi:YesN/AraC family two-component response regulator